MKPAKFTAKSLTLAGFIAWAADDEHYDSLTGIIGWALGLPCRVFETSIGSPVGFIEWAPLLSCRVCGTSIMTPLQGLLNDGYYSPAGFIRQTLWFSCQVFEEQCDLPAGFIGPVLFLGCRACSFNKFWIKLNRKIDVMKKGGGLL